jgi:hypothetical protein
LTVSLKPSPEDEVQVQEDPEVLVLDCLFKASPEDEVQVQEDKEEDGAAGDEEEEEDPKDPGLKGGRGL